MQTIQVDVMNKRVMWLFQYLERLRFIKLHKEKEAPKVIGNRIAQYKGKMSKQSISDIDKQLADLRNEWE